MTKVLSSADIRDLLICFAAAIELDQIRVDAMLPQSFHPAYDDGMWRTWRREHLEYIDQLLGTVDAISLAMLEELTAIATTCAPELVRQVALRTFAEAVSGICPREEYETASLFFGWLIEGVNNTPRGGLHEGDARGLMLQWLPATDPLGIAQDPECGYGQPGGFVS
jgi:hypothetical protein